MKIVYRGSFLEEGLLALGHELFPLTLNEDSDFTLAVKETCPDPDMVLIEIFAWDVGKNISPCPFPLVAYCIDTPIRIYTNAHILKLFDNVFVDQLSSVQELKKHGITALWLPLCISEKCFRNPTPVPKYNISFVGLHTEHRIKRKNLLSYVQKTYAIHQWAGLSAEEMQDVFSDSCIVLNENLFAGFTLRVLQGMVAGALVLTEANMEGVDKHFQDGTHLVCYEPHNLLNKIQDVFDRPQHYREIAAQGQALCRLQHTSRVRAGELLTALENKTNLNDRKYGDEALFYENMHAYTLCRRHGGSFNDALQIFEKLSQGNSLVAFRASCVLGDILSRMNKKEDAQNYYTQALAQCSDEKEKALIYCRLALLELTHSEIKQATIFIQNAVKILLPSDNTLIEELDSCSSLPNPRVILFSVLVHLYDTLGIIFYLGFFKSEKELCPETAVEIALRAWTKNEGTYLLDFILEKLKQYHAAGDLLPQLSDAVFTGNVTTKQLLAIIEVAESYYDKELACKCIELAKKIVR